MTDEHIQGEAGRAAAASSQQAGKTTPAAPTGTPAAASATQQTTAEPDRAERVQRLRRWISPAVAVALVGGLVAGGVAGFVAAGWRGTGGSCDAERVARDALPSVVTIFVQSPTGSGSGSGAVLRPDGVIVTNDHVIASAATSGSINVQLNDGQIKPATLVGRDPKTDLAVLKVDASGLPTMPLGDSQQLAVGQPVVALGAPLGLSGTVTSGIVSALNRDVPAPTGDGGMTVLVGTIQTDASINPGNSGGPLVDCTARLVGVNTAISTVPTASGDTGGGSVGIGFAVPCQRVQSITDQLLASGRAAHPWFGMSMVPIPDGTPGAPAGMVVASVVAGGPAAQAGLQTGDVITSINGQQASTVAVANVLVRANVGDSVSVTYLRNGARTSTTLTLQEQP